LAAVPENGEAPTSPPPPAAATPVADGGDESSSEVDGTGRLAIAVVVCGPHDMVIDALDAVTAINASALGRRVVLHVHHETFRL